MWFSRGLWGWIRQTLFLTNSWKSWKILSSFLLHSRELIVTPECIQLMLSDPTWLNVAHSVQSESAATIHITSHYKKISRNCQKILPLFPLISPMNSHCCGNNFEVDAFCSLSPLPDFVNNFAWLDAILVASSNYTQAVDKQSEWLSHVLHQSALFIYHVMLMLRWLCMTGYVNHWHIQQTYHMIIMLPDFILIGHLFSGFVKSHCLALLRKHSFRCAARLAL